MLALFGIDDLALMLFVGSIGASIFGGMQAHKAQKSQEKAMKEMYAQQQQQKVPAIDRTSESQRYGSSEMKRMLANMFGRRQTVLTGPEGKKNRTILGV